MAAKPKFQPGERVTLTLRGSAGPLTARGRVTGFNEAYVLLSTDFGSRRIRLSDIKGVQR